MTTTATEQSANSFDTRLELLDSDIAQSQKTLAELEQSWKQRNKPLLSKGHLLRLSFALNVALSVALAWLLLV